MKVGNTAEIPAALASTHPAAAPHEAAKAAASSAIPSSADASATLELSGAASTLLAGGTSAEFDAEKVARISKAIEDGSYRIDAGVIADKLIGNAQELLAKIQP